MKKLTLIVAGVLCAMLSSASTLTPFYPNDPYFVPNTNGSYYPGQWNLINQAPGVVDYTTTTSWSGKVFASVTITNAGLDMNLSNAWALGYTGTGIVVGIADDGVESNHPDLSVRWDLSMGFDSNSLIAGQSGAHVRPVDDSHGTCVAGTLAARGGNGIGLCGPAPYAQIASMRISFLGLDDYFVHAPGYYWQAGLGWTSGMSSAQLAGLTHLDAVPGILIKNSSTRALPYAYTPDFGDHHSAWVRMSANGVISTLAAGNCRDSKMQDSSVFVESCNPYAINVSALGSDGRFALYSSFGASVFACTLSESAYWNPQNLSGVTHYANGFGVAATDRLGTNGVNYHGDSTVYLQDLDDVDYTSQFDGTSAAAPLMAGILALARQANPNLGPRMARHLLARNSRQVDPGDHSASATWSAQGAVYSGWRTNVAGFAFNPNYGFGLPDATALVTNALRTAYVTRETLWSSGLLAVAATNQTLAPAHPTGKTETITVNVPVALRQNLESVEVFVNVAGGDRSEWEMVLCKSNTSSRIWSASNTKSNAGSFYFDDLNPTGGVIRFLLAHAFWGEDPNGAWTLTVANPTGTNVATWTQWGLVLHMGDIAFEAAGMTVTASDLDLCGLTLNQAGTQGTIQTNATVRTCGDVWLNAGLLVVNGILSQGSTVTVSRLDTTLAQVTEDLAYRRGIRVDVAGGTLAGTGLIEMPTGTDGRGGVFNTAGTVRAGDTNGHGSLTIHGDYTQSATGTLELYVGADRSAGCLVVSGNASLGGRLRVVTDPTASISPGFRLTNMISAVALSGAFDSVDAWIPAPQSNFYWEIVQNGTGIDLVARPSYSNTIAALTAYITNLMAVQHVTGVSIALVDDQEVVWATGFGFADKEQGIPADSNTVYRIASVSKTFTSAAIMQLIDQGRLALDTPLTNCLPGFSLLPRFTNSGPITIRNLMNHHSGIPGNIINYSDTVYESLDWQDWSAWLMDDLKDDYPVIQPDQVNSYCNSGFVLLGDVVGAVSGTQLVEYAENNLFGPLGMAYTSFLMDKALVTNNLTRPYLDGVPQLDEHVNCIATGGMLSSVSDLARFAKMFLAMGLSSGNRILSTHAILAMAEPQGTSYPLNVGSTFTGLGWDSVKEPDLEYAGRVCWKDGGSAYFNSFFGVALDGKIGVVVLENSSGSIADDAGKLALQLMVQEKNGLLWPTNVYVPPFSPVASASQSELDALAGIYAAGSGYTKVEAGPGSLTIYGNAQRETPTVFSNLVMRSNGWFSLATSQSNQFAFTNLSGRSVLVVHSAKGLSYEECALMGERCTPGAVPAAWSTRMDRSYWPCNVHPNDVLWVLNSLPSLALRQRDGFPLLYNGDSAAIMAPQSDALAFLLGFPSRNDGAIQAVTAGGAELLKYNGYLFCNPADIPTLATGVTTNGSVLITNGIAWYAFHAVAGNRYAIDVLGTGAPFFPRIVREAPITLMASGSTNAVEWSCSSNGVYYVALCTATPQSFVVRLSRLVAAGVNDFDGDRLSDIAVYDAVYGPWHIRGSNGQALVWGVPWGGGGRQAMAADYNGDSIADPGVYDTQTGYWYAKKTDGTLLFWAEPWGGIGFTPVAGDFDGDGQADLAGYHAVSGLWYIRSLVNAGESLSLRPTSGQRAFNVLAWAVPWGGSNMRAVSGDYDGDGVSDLCVYDEALGYWYARSVSGRLIAWAVRWGGGAGFVPVSGDYNGDGVSDLCVYDEALGLWYVAALDGTILAWQARWGGPGMKPVPGDYDGDGISDAAVYREADGVWYVMSATGAILHWALPWGGPGLTPIVP